MLDDLGGTATAGQSKVGEMEKGGEMKPGKGRNGGLEIVAKNGRREYGIWERE
jgi:hypothetical protein